MKVRGRERAANARKYEDGEATVGPARGYTARERVGSGAPVPDERSSQSRGPHTAVERSSHGTPSIENPRVKTVPVLQREMAPQAPSGGDR